MWLLGLAPAAWAAVVVGSRGSPVEATLYVGAFVIAGTAFAAWWAGRIASARFIVRVGGTFHATGRFRQRLSGDKTRCSLAGPTGTLMLDGHDPGLQSVWDRVNARGSRGSRLLIDHTPTRYVLAVAEEDGSLLYTREDYSRPPTKDVLRHPPADRGSRLIAGVLGLLWPFALGLACVVGSWLVFIMPTTTDSTTFLWSAQIWLSLGIFITGLAVLVVAGFRTLVTIGEWIADPRRGWAG
jgi:hypothetical protein